VVKIFLHDHARFTLGLIIYYPGLNYAQSVVLEFCQTNPGQAVLAKAWFDRRFKNH